MAPETGGAAVQVRALSRGRARLDLGSGGWEGQTWNDDEDFVGRRRKRSFRKSKKD